MTFEDRILLPYPVQVAYSVARYLVDNGYDVSDIHDAASIYNIVADADDVTGNLSGSYWCSRYDAARCIAEHWSDMIEAVEETGEWYLFSDPEKLDVLCRVYYMDDACRIVCETMQDAAKWWSMCDFVTREWG